MSTQVLLWIAIFSGICFGSMSFSYQKGKQFQIPAPHIAFVVLIVGCTVFTGYMYYNHLARSLPPGNPWKAPALLWILTVAGGMGQVASVTLLDQAMKRGPAAPAFCIMNLAFLPAAIYAVIILRHHLSPLQIIGLLAAVACVLIAGRTTSSSPAEAQHAIRARGGALIYPLLMTSLMLATSLASIAMLQLQEIPADGGSLFNLHHGLYLVLIYGVGFIGIGLSISLHGKTRIQFKRTLLLGLLAATGSVFGFSALSLASALPGGIGFAITNTVCFLTIGFISAFIFKERRNAAWYLTIGLAVISVTLFASGLTS